MAQLHGQGLGQSQDPGHTLAGKLKCWGGLFSRNPSLRPAAQRPSRSPGPGARCQRPPPPRPRPVRLRQTGSSSGKWSPRPQGTVR